MRRIVALFFVIAVGIGAALTLEAQSGAAPYEIVAGLGLPAVDRGVLTGVYHQPTHAASMARSAAAGIRAEQTRLGRAGTPYTRGKLIVKFRSGSDASNAIATSAPGATVMPRSTYANFDVLSIDPNADAEAIADALNARPDVEYAQASYVAHALFVPNDALYKAYQWNLPLINMEGAWDIQRDAGSTITVAVVDTGVAYTSATLRGVNIATFIGDNGSRYPAIPNATIPLAAAPQLVGGTAISRIVAPHDFVNDNNTPYDLDGHGTHVSGTIGQLTNDGIGTAGVAFNVKLMPLKADCEQWDILFGTPLSRCGEDRIALAIRYAADNGAKVINMSLGRTGPAACAQNPSGVGCARVVEDAMRYAVSKGVFIAVAAGNEFEDGNPTSAYAEIASRIPGVVSVAAVDITKAHARYSTAGPYVELAAPGGGGGSAESGFVWQQTYSLDFSQTFDLPVARYTAPRFDVLEYVGYAGTSMASPHVAGVAAMLMQQGITDPAVVEAALERFAIDLGDKGRDNFFGFGMVDARATLYGLGLTR